MNKFPWVQYATTLLFYLVIAAGIVIISSVLPQTKPRQLTAEEAQAVQQQQQLEQTRQIYQRVLSAVGRLMVLPNVLPQISVVQDPITFVKQNPIFAGTEAGDIVLIYNDKVIIYSPKYDRIVHSESVTPAPQQLSGTNNNVPTNVLPPPANPATDSSADSVAPTSQN